MLKKTLSFLLFLVVCNITQASPIDNYTIMTESYPPYSYQEGNALKGVCIETWGLVLKNLNSKQTSQDVKLLPWARAYASLQNDNNTMVTPMTRTAGREHLFKWVGPVAPTTVVLMAQKSKGIKINSLSEITKYTIGAVPNEVAELLLLSNHVPTKNISEVPNIIENVKKIRAGRIDIIASEEHVTKWTLKQQGEKISNYETVFTLKSGYIYFAFSKNTPDNLISEAQAALDKVKQSDEYKKILNNYLNLS